MNTRDIALRFDEVAENYDRQRRCFIPRFDDFYETGISLLDGMRRQFQSVLDLGAGTGLLSQYLFRRYPMARYTLADISGQMMDVARQRFQGLHNFSFIMADYSVELPEGSFDLIASALSIHHLENRDKESLYGRIYESLEPGGCFLNLDQFNADSERVNRLYNEYWIKYIEGNGINGGEMESLLKRRALDRENTVEETLGMLRDAGFRTADCVYSFMKFGVIMAVRD